MGPYHEKLVWTVVALYLWSTVGESELVGQDPVSTKEIAIRLVGTQEERANGHLKSFFEFDEYLDVDRLYSFRKGFGYRYRKTGSEDFADPFAIADGKAEIAFTTPSQTESYDFEYWGGPIWVTKSFDYQPLDNMVEPSKLSDFFDWDSVQNSPLGVTAKKQERDQILRYMSLRFFDSPKHWFPDIDCSPIATGGELQVAGSTVEVICGDRQPDGKKRLESIKRVYGRGAFYNGWRIPDHGIVGIESIHEFFYEEERLVAIEFDRTMSMSSGEDQILSIRTEVARLDLGGPEKLPLPQPKISIPNEQPVILVDERQIQAVWRDDAIYKSFPSGEVELLAKTKFTPTSTHTRYSLLIFSLAAFSVVAMWVRKCRSTNQ